MANNNSNFTDGLLNQKGSFKTKNEKVTSPVNQINLASLKSNNLNNGAKGMAPPSNNNQGFSSKVTGFDNSLSSLKKNVDMNSFNINQATSHLKSNNTQNLTKGLSRLNDNKPAGDGPSFEKTNFTGNVYGKYPPGKFQPKDYK